MENDKTITMLNDLLQITNDSLKGFQEVDKKMISNYGKLATEYQHIVTESDQMKTDLAELIRAKGGDPDQSTTIAGGLHRGWIEVKNSLTADKDQATLSSVVFGEEAAIKSYKDALDSDNLDSDARNLLSDQLDKLEASLKKFKSFEDSSSFE